MEKTAAKKRGIPIPHSLVFIFAFVVFAAILTWVVPAGEYARVFDEANQMEVVVPDSFQYIDQTPVGVAKMFECVGQGFVDQAQIIFFIIFAYAFVGSLISNGVFDALIKKMLSGKLRHSNIVIPILILFFGILGSVAGIAEEVFGLFPVVLALAVALGYDEIVGGAMIYVAVFTGFAAATMNPFTIGIAQSIAQVPLFSGMGLRIAVFVVFMGTLIFYTLRYGKKVKEDPTKSLLYEPGKKKASYENADVGPVKLTTAQILSTIVFVLVIVAVVAGAILKGWYLTELTALFFAGMILIGIVNKRTPNQIAEDFVKQASDTTFSILSIGMCNVICYVMNAGHITDTVLHGMASILSRFSNYFGGILMMILQTLLNFFIPSGPGQAAVSMPIMAPLADLTGLTRQFSVLAFQFGDGFSNLFWPTMVTMMCGMLKIPVTKWYKFIAPLFGIYFLLQIAFVVLAIGIGY